MAEPVSLDPLIHSLRWNRENVVRRAYRSLNEWRKMNYGDRPDCLYVTPEMRRDLILWGYHQMAVGFEYAAPYGLVLFGIPIRVLRSARGFQWSGGRPARTKSVAFAIDNRPEMG